SQCLSPDPACRSSVPTSRTPPLSPLFPYTTLFRSVKPTSLTCCSTRPRKIDVSPARLTRPSSSSAGTLTSSCGARRDAASSAARSEEHTSELQSHLNLVCRLLPEQRNAVSLLVRSR